MRKINVLFLTFAITCAGLISSCSTSKTDYASAYKFSSYNYNKTTPDSNQQNEVVIDEQVAIETDVEAAPIDEAVATLDKQAVLPTVKERLEQASNKLETKANQASETSGKNTKLTKEDRKELKTLIKQEVKKIKEYKNKKSVEGKQDMTRNMRTGLILGIVGLALMLIGTAAFYTIGAILFIVGLVIFLLDVL